MTTPTPTPPTAATTGTPTTRAAALWQRLERRPSRSLVVGGAVHLGSMLVVLVLVSRAVDGLSDQPMSWLPGSGWLTLAVLVAALLVCLVRGNVRTGHRPLRNLRHALGVSPAVLAVGVIVWAVLAWLTPIPVPLVVVVTSLLIGLAVAQTLLVFWRGPVAPPRLATAPSGPSPGQVWWAEVPFEESAASKERPVLVLEVGPTYLVVLMFTSQDKSADRRYVLAPASMWREAKLSYLRLDRRIHLPRSELRRFECDPRPDLLRQAGLTLS